MDNHDVVHVSPEMVAIIGAPPLSGLDLPLGSATLRIGLDYPASLRIHNDATTELPELHGPCITLVVMRDALTRLFDWSPLADDGHEYFIDPDIAAIAEQIVAARHAPEAKNTYRLGKSIELLCEIIAGLKDGRCQPAHRDLSLSRVDSQRLGAARAIIDAHWSEKLTLGTIARRCGLNRTKLSRGFRELYSCSVSEALADKRLAEARRQLLSTDLPVSVIGYRTGYSNNASFSRAFGRRFGQSPREFRMSGAAA